MGQFFGGRAVPMVGVAGVGVDPCMRGAGLGRRLMTAAVRELAARGTPLSVLYPATSRIYEAVGYGFAGTRFESRVPIDRVTGSNVASARSEPLIRPLTDRDAPAVREIYRETALHSNGFLDRGPYVWHRVSHVRDARVLGYGIEEDGALTGYVYFTQQSSPEVRYDLMVRDWGARDARARAAVLALLHDQRSLAESVVFYGEPWDPCDVFDHEQRHLSVRVQERFMLRIVDVAAALTARGYPRAVSATLTFEVEDPIVRANSGCFTVRVEAGRARVRRGGTAAIALDITSLAALYSGHRSPFALSAAGLLAGPPRALELAASIFSGPPPTMRDFF